MLSNRLKMVFLFLLISVSGLCADWAMYMGNHHLTGNNDNVVPKNFQLAWRYQAKNRIFHSVASDGMVICSTLRGKVVALNLANGKKVWTFDTRYPVIRMPVIYKDMVYISAGRYLYCLDKWRGKLVWGRSYRGFSQLSTPIVENGVLYYGNRGAFFARNANNGSLIWRNDQVMTYGGSPVYSDGYIYSQHRDYNRLRYYLVCLRASDGQQIWRKPIPRDANVFTPLVYRGIVYMASGYMLTCYNSLTGATKNTRRFEKRVASNPMIVAGVLYIALTDGRINILQLATLRLKRFFKHRRPKGNRFSSVGKWLYLADNSGTIFEINNQDGTKSRSYATGARQTHAFPLLFEGRVLFPAGKTLFCLGRYPQEQERPLKKGRIRLVFYNKESRRLLDGSINIVLRTSKSVRHMQKQLEKGQVWLEKGIFPAQLTFEKRGFFFAVRKVTRQHEGGTLKIFLKPIHKGSKLVFHDILFNRDSSGLLPASLPVLQRLVRFMKQNSRIRIAVHGHTDSSGAPTYNRKLSLARAKVVSNYLVKHNIAITRIDSAGFGASKPIADNKTAKGRQLNRRTEIKIIGFFSRKIRRNKDESFSEREEY